MLEKIRQIRFSSLLLLLSLVQLGKDHTSAWAGVDVQMRTSVSTTNADRCTEWLDKRALQQQMQKGDIIAVRESGTAAQRVVIYVGDNFVVYEYEDADGGGSASGEKKMVLGKLDDLIGAEGQGCVSNVHDNATLVDDATGRSYELIPIADPDRIEQQALSRVGTKIGSGIGAEQRSSLTAEEQLANAARYNLTWIEDQLGQSSMKLQEQIGGASLDLKNQIDNLFGKFTQMLFEKAGQSLQASSAGSFKVLAARGG